MKPLIHCFYLHVALGALIVLPPSSINGQSNCDLSQNFEFDHFWADTYLAEPLGQYFSALEAQPDWSDILFSKGEEEESAATSDFRGEAMEEQHLIELFTTKVNTEPENTVLIPVTAGSQHMIYWVVHHSTLIKELFPPNELGQFFLTRPNRTTKINYCDDRIFIQSWQCWASYRKFSQTAPLMGASIIVRTESGEIKHYEWVSFSNLIKEWGLDQ